MNVEELIKSYYDDLEKNKDRLKKYENLKILSVNEIVEKIEHGDKDFSGVRIVGIDWARRDLSGCNFSGSKLEWNIFGGCKLTDANFSNVFIDWCGFSNADLTKANFENAIIWDSTFDGAILNDAVFTKTDLGYVTFADANIGAANFAGAAKNEVYEKWEDLKEENLDATIAILEKVNLLSTSRLLALKALLEKYKTKLGKFKAFYDIGRSLANPKGNLYKYPTVGGGALAGGGIYVDGGKSSIYTAKVEYGTKRSKDEKEVIYGK